MDAKRITNSIFFIVGTFIILSIGLVISINFYKDSRFFESTVSAFKNSGQDEENEASEEYETFKYKKTQDEYEPTGSSGTKNSSSKNSSGSSFGLNSNNSNTELSNIGKGVKIELISYLKDDVIFEKIVRSFINRSYSVYAFKANASKGYSTRIIERNEKGLGMDIYKFLKTGVLIRDFKPNYKYDVTLIIGQDYRP